MKVLLVGGHLTPLLAVGQALQKQSAIEIVSIARTHTMEGDKTPAKELSLLQQFGPVYTIAAGRLQRRFTRYTIPSLLKMPLGFWQAFFLVKKLRPDVVVSFGSYLSVPVVFAAWLLNIPSLTHEQSVRAGLANRINGWFVKKIAVSFSPSQSYFPKDKTVVTGNPLRESIFADIAKSPEVANFLANVKKPLIYVTGGNQGSHVINQAIFGILDQLLVKYAVIHQTGSTNNAADLLQAKDIKNKLGDLGQSYYPLDYFNEDDIGAIYHRAELMVCRSGANTVSEILALKKHALLIPIPWAQHNEQYENAKLVTGASLGMILEQKDITSERLFSCIEALAQMPKQERANIMRDTTAAEQLVILIRSVAKG